MYQDIMINKIKTGFIVSIFILIITLIVYYICTAYNLGASAIPIALAVSIVSAFSSYYFSDKMVLKMNGARPATVEEDRKLVDILDGLMISSGLKYRPKLYVMESDQPNAFATGRNPKNAVICVTTGLLNKMNYYELEGVVAHELSHIKNYDILLSAVVTVMVGFIVMVSDWVTRYMFWGRRGRSKSDREGGNAIILILGLIALILGPIFAKLMQLAVSRRREYLADATSVEFTRNPDGLISALQKLDTDNTEFARANNATAHMFIANPFKMSSNGKKRVRNLMSTHPPISDRIEALRKLK